jgi:hypothetical protein
MRLTLDVNDDALPPTGQDVRLRGERGHVTVQPADLQAADVLRVSTATAEELQGYSRLTRRVHRLARFCGRA